MKDYLEKRREELSKREEGFTLMEMLIVVAIIAVLIAIAIPIFTSQLENSREAADAANIRSAYAEVMADALTVGNGSTPSREVEMTQRQDGWQNTFSFPKNLSGNETLVSTGTVTIQYTAPSASADDSVSINIKLTAEE